jgi:type IV pilus assembly protein PilC
MNFKMKKINIKKILKNDFVSSVFFIGLSAERMHFVENLAALLGAGLGVVQSLDSIYEETRSWRFKKVVKEIIDDVNSGVSLSKSLQSYGILPEHIISLINTGEMSGRLVENLKIVVTQNEKEAMFRSRLKSSVLYAGIIFTLAIAVLIGMSWFVLPKIASFFETLNQELPLVSRIIISIGKFFEQYGIIVVPVFVILVIFTIYFLFSFPRTKFLGHTILFKVPLIRTLIKEVEVARFGFLLGTMIDSGMVLSDAIYNMKTTTTFKNYQDSFDLMFDLIQKGYSFQQIFYENNNLKKIYPSAVRQMIVAGEKSGTLSISLIKIGHMYENKTETSARNLPVILEPLLLIFVALIVAVLAFGILMPIYNLSFSVE